MCAAFQFKVRLVLEGVPPHALERHVVESLLGSSCLVDTLGPKTSSRADLSAFCLTTWTTQPKEIPSLRWLAVPEPGLRSLLMEPTLLQYKVISTSTRSSTIQRRRSLGSWVRRPPLEVARVGSQTRTVAMVLAAAKDSLPRVEIGGLESGM